MFGRRPRSYPLKAEEEEDLSRVSFRAQQWHGVLNQVRSSFWSWGFVIHGTVTAVRMMTTHASGAEHVTFLQHRYASLKILPTPVICDGFSGRFRSDPNCLMICFLARAFAKKPFPQVTKSTLSRQHCLICEAGLPLNRLRYCPVLSPLGFRGHSSCMFINTASESWEEGS